jgi:hypothetical protein
MYCLLAAAVPTKPDRPIMPGKRKNNCKIQYGSKVNQKSVIT